MTARMCWTSMPKGRALEGVGIVCREPELARDTVRVVWFRSSRAHVAVGACVTYIRSVALLCRAQTFFFNPLLCDRSHCFL